MVSDFDLLLKLLNVLALVKAGSVGRDHVLIALDLLLISGVLDLLLDLLDLLLSLDVVLAELGLWEDIARALAIDGVIVSSVLDHVILHLGGCVLLALALHLALRFAARLALRELLRQGLVDLMDLDGLGGRLLNLDWLVEEAV